MTDLSKIKPTIPSALTSSIFASPHPRRSTTTVNPPARQYALAGLGRPSLPTGLGFLPRACSGGMYATVPIVTPGLVRASSVGPPCQLRYVTPLWHKFSQPEVEDLRLPACRHKDVRRLNAPVNDPV